MSLKDKITSDMKTAMRSGDKPRLSVVRMALAAIKQREIDERITLDDAQTLAVIDKMVKQRRESIAQFRAGGRDDLATKEQAEVDVLLPYLPAQLNADELAALIDDAIASTGADSVRDMGKVMGIMKSRAAGRADMGEVSKQVRARLSQA